MKFSGYFFVIISFLTAITSSNAMENNNQLQKYAKHWLSEAQEITIVKDPWRARYCAKNKVIVGGIHGSVHKVNLKTQRTLNIGQTFNYDSQLAPGLQANKKKMMIVRGSETMIYDTETGISSAFPMKIDKKVRSFAWNPLIDALFLCYGEQSNTITKYNYKADKYKEISVSDQNCQIMTMHPQKKIMCIADYSGNISLRNIDDTLSKIKSIDLSKKLETCWFCQYSLDGSRIVVGNGKKIFIINPDIDEDDPLCVDRKINPGIYEEFKNIAFHSNGSILAILCYRNITQSRKAVY
jgi:Eukaryotic translation initiation factor eIF2A